MLIREFLWGNDLKAFLLLKSAIFVFPHERHLKPTTATTTWNSKQKPKSAIFCFFSHSFSIKFRKSASGSWQGGIGCRIFAERFTTGRQGRQSYRHRETLLFPHFVNCYPRLSTSFQPFCQQPGRLCACGAGSTESIRMPHCAAFCGEPNTVIFLKHPLCYLHEFRNSTPP